MRWGAFADRSPIIENSRDVLAHIRQRDYHFGALYLSRSGVRSEAVISIGYSVSRVGVQRGRWRQLQEDGADWLSTRTGCVAQFGLIQQPGKI